MKKIEKPIYKKLPPLVLYLNDIQELYKFLKEITDEQVVIETNGYRLNSPDELSGIEKDKTNSFTIKYEESFFKDDYSRVEICLEQNHGSIYVNREDIKAQGIAANIEKILLPHKKSNVPHIVSNVLFICSLVIFILSLKYPNSNTSIVLIGIVSFIGIACLALLGHLHSYRWYNTVFFKSRKEAPSFWKRNKDQIIVGIVTGVIVAIISSFVTVVITKKVTIKTNTVSESNSQKITVQQDVNSH